jgi:hypothetical protein
MSGREYKLMISTGDVSIQVTQVTFSAAQVEMIASIGYTFPDIGGWTADQSAHRFMDLAEALMASPLRHDDATRRDCNQLGAELVVAARTMARHYLTTVVVS